MAFICPCHLHMTCMVHILHVHSLRLALQCHAISSYISFLLSLLCSYYRFWRILVWSISIIIMVVNVYFIIIQVVSRIYSL